MCFVLLRYNKDFILKKGKGRSLDRRKCHNNGSLKYPTK